MKCVKCHKEIKGNANFCIYCGAPVGQKKPNLKKKKRIFILIPMIIALSLIIVILVFFSTKTIKKRKYDRNMEIADKYYNDMKYDEAKAYYNNALKYQSDSIEAYAGLTKTAKKTDDHEGVVSNAKKVIELEKKKSKGEKVHNNSQKQKKDGEEVYASAEAYHDIIVSDAALGDFDDIEIVLSEAEGDVDDEIMTELRQQSDNAQKYSCSTQAYDDQILSEYRKIGQHESNDYYNEDGTIKEHVLYDINDEEELISNVYLSFYKLDRGCKLYYAYHDLDGDGTPELFLSASEDGFTKKIYACYTYDGNNVKSLCQFKTLYADETRYGLYQNCFLYYISQDGYIYLVDDVSMDFQQYVLKLDSEKNELVPSDESVVVEEESYDYIYTDNQGNRSECVYYDDVVAAMRERHPELELEWKEIDRDDQSNHKLYQFLGFYKNEKYTLSINHDSVGDTYTSYFTIRQKDNDTCLDYSGHLYKVLGNNMQASYDYYEEIDHFLDITLQKDGSILAKIIPQAKNLPEVWEDNDLEGMLADFSKGIILTKSNDLSDYDGDTDEEDVTGDVAEDDLSEDGCEIYSCYAGRISQFELEGDHLTVNCDENFEKFPYHADILFGEEDETVVSSSVLSLDLAQGCIWTWNTVMQTNADISDYTSYDDMKKAIEDAQQGELEFGIMFYVKNGKIIRINAVSS